MAGRYQVAAPPAGLAMGAVHPILATVGYARGGPGSKGGGGADPLAVLPGSCWEARKLGCTRPALRIIG